MFNRKSLLVWARFFFTMFPLGYVILKIIPVHISLALFVSERMLIVEQPMIRIKAALKDKGTSCLSHDKLSPYIDP